MTAALNADKLGKLLALASSDNDAEALAALRKAKGMLGAAGMDFKDVAERVAAPKTSTTEFDFAEWAREAAARQPAKPPKPKGYTKGNFTWESKAAYDAYMARQKAQREAERQRYAPQRAAVLEKYGSEAAAIARDPREQALHDAALPWLEGPFEPTPGFEYLAGRWHDSMGGWRRYDFGKHPVDECRAAIMSAIPMPQTIREARAEAQYWNQRSDEICHAIESWGDEQLDLPASYRREIVRKMFERDMPIVTLDDLLVRLEFAADSDGHDDAHLAAPPILDAFNRLVINGASSNLDSATPPVPPVQTGHPTSTAARRAHVLDMLKNVETASWSDRAIAKAAGVSPTTVGNLRRQVRGAA
ncbi:DUF2786 domain-containing protein [Magnetospirillum molischianum]|uniref:Uncharacterized protein n=1 Tax=Magnetospirillum molischianum DSM 120 TaxID=1150626 RepID=H8FTW3_MAGML|nr:DUF2786 domain-containing protein [Magnetospirillum molischianum]CCG41820.1 hypothetical protein PHAMO_290108 [Magnetospirillum molischianum DSM 120]